MAQIFCRHFRVRVRELEAGFLSRETALQRVLATLCDTAERGGGELHLPAAAHRLDARELESMRRPADSFRMQGASADHPYSEAEGIRVHAGIAFGPSIRCEAPGGWGRYCFSCLRISRRIRICWRRFSKSFRETCDTPSSFAMRPGSEEDVLPPARETRSGPVFSRVRDL